MAGPCRRHTPVDLAEVHLIAGLMKRRVDINRTRSLPIELQQMRDTGRLDSLKHNWSGSEQDRPHHFWDSDIAKWIEACAYSLAQHEDPELEAAVDEAIDDIACNQGEDGYFNTYYRQVDPDKRWSDLGQMHELYCAGHLMEAAVAYARATGKRKLLDAMCRYADYIGHTFGAGEGQIPGYPGHEEIELALVKLYRETGVKRYLDLSKYFVDQRGTQPHFFVEENKRLGRKPHVNFDYVQAHLPVREQTTVEGHSVRACYLYAGMADVAAETGDAQLMKACRALWHNMTERRMYVTGGIGSTRWGERFTFDYDLPNETAYAETCAQIALVFFGHRMLQMELDRTYADPMELALYNSILSGVSLDGTAFFYDNFLQVCPPAHQHRQGQKPPVRQAWFGCACCPPNIARLLAGFGQYLYTTGKGELAVHFYAANRATATVGDTAVELLQTTDYPWDETVTLEVNPSRETSFTLCLRLPGWCDKPSVKVNGKPVKLDEIARKGYARIKRTWAAGDAVELKLPMPIRRIEAHPKVRQDVGRIALMRGPVVYCLEEIDNGANVFDIRLPRNAKLTVSKGPRSIEGAPVLKGKALRRDQADWRGQLYRPAGGSKTRTVEVTAVPYFAWGNRKPGEMTVWIHEA